MDLLEVQRMIIKESVVIEFMDPLKPFDEIYFIKNVLVVNDQIPERDEFGRKIVVLKKKKLKDILNRLAEKEWFFK